MATTEKYAIGTTVTLMSTELNSLASNGAAGAISSVGGTSGLFNNTVGGGSMDGYTLGRLELKLAAPAGSLTLNSIVNVWFLSTVDGGTTYEDGGAGTIPQRIPDAVFPVRAVSTAQVIHRNVILPPGNWFVLLSQATGQTWGATLNTLKVAPITRQGV